MASVFKYAIKQSVKNGSELGTSVAFRNIIMKDGVASMGDRQLASKISQALNLSGVADIPKASFLKEIDEIPEASLEKALAKTAKTSPEQFDDVIRRLHSGDEASHTALRKFYTDNPSLQSQIKEGVGDNADTFFKGMDGSVKELNESQIKNLGAAQGITRAGFAAADGGKKFFTKVWDDIGTGKAWNRGKLVIGAGVAWVVIDVLASLTGQTKLEFFSDLFEFIKDPSASLFADDDGDGINGSWKLTSLGQMVFGTVALFGIALAVKLIKTLKPSEA